MFVIGRIVDLDTEQVIIEPLEADAEMHIPYFSYLDGINRISFNRNSVGDQLYIVGDIVTVTYINKIQYGDPCRIDTVTWSLFET